nr:hypothetical protein CFP56_06522 [Quercus suber]
MSRFEATSKAASQKKSMIKALSLEVWEIVFRVWWRFGLLRRGIKKLSSTGEAVLRGISGMGGRRWNVIDGVVELTVVMYWLVELAP